MFYLCKVLSRNIYMFKKKCRYKVIYVIWFWFLIKIGYVVDNVGFSVRGYCSSFGE